MGPWRLSLGPIRLTLRPCRLSLAHCNEKSIYVFPEKELLGLSTNFHVHVPVSIYIIPGSVLIFSYRRIGRPIVGIYKLHTGT